MRPQARGRARPGASAAVLHASRLADQIGAVIVQQTDLHRLLIDIGDWEALDAVLDDRSCDRERVDLIGLAGLALSSPGSAHPVRRDPHDAFAGQ